MTMAFDYQLASNYLLATEAFTPKPFITGWNRLEGRVRVEEFDRALRAEVRDPLWFLTRQWQFLELKGDDAGSPIEARLAAQSTKLELYSTVDGAPQPFPTAFPLEAVVEREPVPFDRVALIQIQRAFDKALVAAGAAPASRKAANDWMRAEFPLDTTRIPGVEDAESNQLASLADDHLFDAAGFLGDVDFARHVDVSLGATDAMLASVIKTAGEIAAQWFRLLYFAPAAGAPTAWVPSKLEYQFRCATAFGETQVVLAGDSYTQGRLDWYCVDVAAAEQTLPSGGGANDGDPRPAPSGKALSFIPAPVRFAGMPSARFWEMEDSRVEFGALTAHTTDIGKLLLIEFMLSYGNDWCVIPFEVDVGTLTETFGMVVHDVFGDATLIRAADRGTDEAWRRWAMFGLETGDATDRPPPRLFMPPATSKMLESAPIERVVFLRDEMANLCWAVERTLPSRAGVGIDGERYAIMLAPAIETPPPPPTATARYRLGTEAPFNWRPFLPAHLPGSVRSVRLQRARLPEQPLEPLGVIIAGNSPYFIDEESVPRAGRIVTRSFQQTRWLDGKVVLWLGRRAKVGRGEGSSGLAFDVIHEISARP